MYEYTLFVSYGSKSVLYNVFDSSESAWNYVDYLLSGLKVLGKSSEGYTFEVVETLKKSFMVK